VQAQVLLWIDIEGKTLHTYSPADERSASFSLPKRAGSIALREADDGLLFAFEDGFAIFNPFVTDTNAAKPPVYIPDEAYIETEPYRQHALVRLNDGRCDRRGRFIAGGYNGDEGDASMNREWEADCGVYAVEAGKGDASFAARELLPFKVRCANSICFSPDGSHLYFTDSPHREIWVFDYDQATGRVVVDSRRVFATVPPPGVPDGSCVDSAGYLWNAEFFSGRVVRYSPEGEVDRVVQLPVSRVTCPCLGGRDLKTLFLTSASVGVEGKEEGAGGCGQWKWRRRACQKGDLWDEEAGLAQGRVEITGWQCMENALCVQH